MLGHFSQSMRNAILFSFFFFFVVGSCDQALGMTDGSIADSQITASSYDMGGEPHEGRLNGNKAWIPYGQLA